MRTRPATAADAAPIARNDNEGIADRVATFETRPRTPADVAAWFDDAHPIVVVEDEAGQIVAFAATSAYRPRACYAGAAKFSVSVARAARGVGRLAMTTLLDAAELAGFHKLLSRVFVENAPSRALLRALGIREVGLYEKRAQFDGEWRDVVIVERLLPAHLR